MFGYFVIYGCVISAVFLLGVAVGSKIENDHWQQQAFKRGYGDFCQKTKTWKWK
jgi:hypothetical protein